MLRDDLVKLLENEINKLNKYSENTHFSYTVTITPQMCCPECGRQESEGYTISGAMGYVFMECECGFKDDDLR
jgi:lysyl-tRNA synthetase class I